ncbi:putative E3 ubiquitin-protein ligase LIN [Vicia villosa]|uniref:putative E3 ubiquitin-protein ligase LIN n=1 Tax=Vicia villosa TaxID=3911 RepID=UPI00273BB3AE|nr:putative E3 ubiquitin-protein ligase LIN [Vicia villosa]
MASKGLLPQPLSPYICHDPKSVASSRGSSSSSQFKRGVGSVSERSNHKSRVSEDSSMDEASVIASVIGILSGYIGRYVKDDGFRRIVREKCSSLLNRIRTRTRTRTRTRHDSDDNENYNDNDDEVFVKMEFCMEKIDRLIEDHQRTMTKSLRNSIEVLTKIASLSSSSKSYLSSCAEFYLAIAYKLLKNDRVSSKHLLQVFCYSPNLARTYLLSDLWDHLFLPHVLHIKIWYTSEFEFLSNEVHVGDKERKLKVLKKVYNERMDSGTYLFAMYYKQWLKVSGASVPPLPIVPLPSRPSCRSSRRMSSDSTLSNSSINPNLYKAVFGLKEEKQKPISLGEQTGILTLSKGLEIDKKLYGDDYKYSSVQKEDMLSFGRSSNHSDKNQAQRLDYFKCLSCRFTPTDNSMAKISYIKSKNASSSVLSSELVEAITTICSSNILTECEFAIRVVTKAWLNSPGDPLIEEALTQTSVIEGILEVLFVSTEDEVLELIISILSELITRNDAIRQIILNSDPQLEIFVRLLKSTSLFLKASVLLYLSKPMAKQMISSEWVPLILRVMEFGDKLQTLFTVQCSPQVAAFYILDQLLNGFDEDKNLENARQVLSLGGLTLLMKRVQEGDIYERENSVSMILCCLRAEGSCRGYLAENIDKSSLLELIVLGRKQNSSSYALSLLFELLYLDRRTKIMKFLRGLKDGWNGLSTMHIFFIYLQKASPEEKPLVAVTLLMLDFMEDNHVKGSIYREEAIEAIVASLNCQICDDRVQQQSAKALLLLGSHFTYAGESLMEKLLLQKAGFQEFSLDDSFPIHKEEEEAESWHKKAAYVLFKSGNKKLLSSLASCVANSIPCLARASLTTISWMCSYLHLVEDTKFLSMAFSILTPHLLQSLSYDNDVEERVLASYSLLHLTKNSGRVPTLPSLNKDAITHLRNLSLVTWTANELISIFTSI